MFPLSNIGEAAFMFVLDDFERVFWNVNQEDFNRSESYDFAEFIWRPYDWNWDLNLDEDKENPPQPVNFECLEVKFWWYKYPGKSMETNVDYDGNQWSNWLDKVLKHLAEVDQDGLS